MMGVMNGRALNNQRPLTAGMTIGVTTSVLCRYVLKLFLVNVVF